MARTRYGDTVKVHYTGKLEDGEVFVSTAEQEPVQFKVGESEVIQGLEEAVVGMRPGESKTTTVQAKDAFGSKREELVMTVARQKLPEDFEPTTGEHLVIHYKDNQSLIFTVLDVTESDVTLDGNHPLAGKALNLEIEMLEILRN